MHGWRERARVSPSMVVALIAVVVAATGGAYAASKTNSKTIGACVNHRGGAVYVAKKCRRRDKRLTWNTTGPRGPAGAPGTPGTQGTQGAQGLPGPAGPVDTSQLVHGSGTITPIPLIDIPNAKKGVLSDIPGVGRFEVEGCAGGGQTVRYTNTSATTEQVLMETVTDGRLDIAPTFVTLVPTGFQENSVDNSEHDILRVSVAVGTTGVAELSISVGRTASLDCLYWGEQYVG